MVAATALLCLAAAANGGSAPASVSITASVDSFAEWADASPTISAGDWNGHINAVDQARTVTKALTLYANVNVTLTPTAGDNDGILTNGSETLSTSYMITGDVGTPDAAYEPAGTGSGEFFNTGNTYSITGRWQQARGELDAACQADSSGCQGVANHLLSVVYALERRPEAMIASILAGQRLLGSRLTPAHVVTQPSPEPVWLSDTMK
jgi:hypothetical protein